jgi:hypothetical protein
VHDPIGLSHDAYVAERCERDPEFAAAYVEASVAMRLEITTASVNEPDDTKGIVTSVSPLPIPADVHGLANRYLELVDATWPGRIEGLYLVGSTALGDYTPGQSDVDFVAVTGEPFTTGERVPLRHVHEELWEAIPRPFFDGIYVTWEHLQQHPATAEDVPFALEGTFQPTGGFEANPSTWLTLARYPLAVRGPAVPSVWYDRAAIRQWNIDNLNSYWRGLVQQGRSAGSQLRSMISDQAMNDILQWCVAGVARLHYTIVTGDITSKSGACRYALATFPDTWHTVINEALALRRGEQPVPRSRLSRRRDVLGFMDFVIDDVNARAAEKPEGVAP